MHVMTCKYNSANHLNEYSGITHANWWHSLIAS